MAVKPLPSIADLRQVLKYDPETGDLRWRKRPEHFFPSTNAAYCWNQRFAGKLAFVSTSSFGYSVGLVFRQLLRAHRVAYAMYHGQWPAGQIDHIDGCRKNNRISNLRDVRHQDNGKNTKLPSTNTSGRIGVSWHKAAKKWGVSIKADDRPIHLGLFVSFEEACAARKAAEEKYGFHPNHGRSA